MGIINKKVLMAGLLLSTALVAPQKANAATPVWVGDTSAEWSNAANWNTDPTAPTTTDDVTISSVGANDAITLPTDADVIIKTLTIAHDGVSAGATSITTQTGYVFAVGNITSAADTVADEAFTLGGDGTLQRANAAGDAAEDGALLINANGAANIIINAVIADVTTGTSVTVGSIGTGAVVLNAVNTFDAGVSVTGGVLVLGNDAAAGDSAGDVAISNGTSLLLDENGNGSADTGLTIGNTVTLTEAGAGDVWNIGAITGEDSTIAKVSGGSADDTLNIGATDYLGAVQISDTTALGSRINIVGSSELIIAGGQNLAAANTITSTDTAYAAANNTGVLTFDGTSNIASTIGTSAAADLATINAGADGEAVTFSANVFANDLHFSNTVASGTIAFDSGADFTGNISTETAGLGILNLGAGSDVSGTIGVSGTELAFVNLTGADASTSIFGGNVYATELNIDNDSTAAFNNGADFNGNVTTDTTNKGTLSFTGTGDSAVVGLVGTDTHRLKAISVGNTGTMAFSGGDVYANGVTVGNGSTATFADDVTTASIVASGTGAATLNGATLNAAVDAIELTSVTGNLTVNSLITDAAAAAQTKVTANSGTGTVVLNGNNAFEGGLEVQTGTVILGHANAAGLSDAADSIELVGISSKVLVAVGSDSIIANNITATGNGATIGTSDDEVEFSGAITGANTLNIGAENYEGLVVLSGDNSNFTGTFAVANDTALNINSANAAGGAGSSFDVTYDSAVAIGSGYFGAEDEADFDKVINVSGGDAWAVDELAGIVAATGKTLNLAGDITASGAGAATSRFQIGEDALADGGAADYQGKVVLNLSEMTGTDITVGNLIVSANGELVGTGTVNGSVTVDAGGVQGPGNSIGIQTITGNYNLNGTLNVEVDSAASYDQVIVTGTATIAQDADINVTDNSVGGSSGRVATGSYNIIQAGTLVADDFITQANLNPAYNGSVAYTYTLGGDTDNYLVLTTTLGGDVYNSVTDPNAKKMFDLLSDGNETISTDLSNLVGNLQNMTSEPQLQDALNDLLPDTGAQVSGMMVGISNINGVINNRMSGNQSGFFGVPSGDDPYAYKTGGLWGQGIYSTANQNKRSGFDGYKANYYGGAAGFDFKISDFNTLGLAYGYIKSDVDGRDKSKGDTNEIETHQLSLYDAYKVNGWGFNSQLGYAWSNFETTRDLTSSGAGKAKGSFDGKIYSLDVNATKDLISQQGFGIVPMVGAKYAYIDLGGYEETGSVAALKVKSRDYHSAKSVVGTKVLLGTASLDWLDNTTFTPSLYGYWSHEFISDSYDVKSTFVGGTTAFKTKGLKPAKDTYNAGVNFDFISSDIFTLSFTYDAEIKEDYLGHTGMVKARFDF